MKRLAWKFAASSAVLGATTFGCMMNGVGTAPASAFQSHSRADTQASQLYDRANRAIADKKLPEAIALLEQAVALAPRDAGYRLLLADAYMKSGRFQSAEATYRDVLTLDGGRTRAALGLALMQVANGRQQDAMAQLEQLEGTASPADLGLAYALAGAPQRAIDLLEPAARAMGATARTRQNLALAYAFGGDWQRARTIAAQDVSPSELGDRMTQWASLTSRANAPDQVASMLGVNKAPDAGQPVQIALAPRPPVAVEAPQVEFASAAPVEAPSVDPETERQARLAFAQAEAASAPAAPVAVAYAEAEAAAPINVPQAAPAQPVQAPVAYAVAEPAYSAPPVAFAQADPVAVPAPVQAPAPVSAEAPAAEYAELETPEWGVDQAGKVQLPKEEPAAERVPVRVQYAAAAENLVRPDPIVMPVANRAVRAMAPVASRALGRAPLPGKRSTNGQYVVQIGAFSSSANAERAWNTYEHRYGLRTERPVTMTIDHNGRLLHRVAISGFAKRGDASQVCQVIRVRGGECFVRSNAGDASIDWAERYNRRA